MCRILRGALIIVVPEFSIDRILDRGTLKSRVFVPFILRTILLALMILVNHLKEDAEHTICEDELTSDYIMEKITNVCRPLKNVSNQLSLSMITFMF